MSGNIEQLSEQLLPMALHALDGMPDIQGSDRGLSPALMGTAAVILSAGGYIADRALGKRKWPTTSPTFSVFPAAAGASTETTIAIGAGFNSCIDQYAEELRPVITQFGTMVAYHGADSGYDPETDNQAFSRICRETGTKKVVLMGLSMRGAENIPVAAHLKGNDGLEVMPVTWMSPMAREDIRGSGRLAMLRFLRASRRAKIEGGVVMRVGLETFGALLDQDGDSKNFRQALMHAVSKARQPGIASNAECQTRAMAMLEFDGSRHLSELHDSPFVCVIPDDPSRDPVVHNNQAVDRVDKERGVPADRVTTPVLAHANLCEHPGEARRLAIEVLSNILELPSAEARRATTSMYSSSSEAV
jgi:hypothetical protein